MIQTNVFLELMPQPSAACGQWSRRAQPNIGHPARPAWARLSFQGSIPDCSSLTRQGYLSPAPALAPEFLVTMGQFGSERWFVFFLFQSKKYFRIGCIQSKYSSIFKIRNTVKFVHFLSNSAQIPELPFFFSDLFHPLCCECLPSSADFLSPVYPSLIPFLELVWLVSLSYGHKPFFCMQSSASHCNCILLHSQHIQRTQLFSHAKFTNTW